MKFEAKLTLVAAAMTAIFLPVMLPAANALPVTGQATITAASCGIVTVGAPAGDLISFGSLSSGGTSAEQSLVLDNTGTTNGRLFVSGANWRGAVGAQAVDVMNVGQTRYSATNTADYASKTPLTSSPVDTLTDITPTTNLTTEWQLQIALLSSQSGFTGPVTQAITLTTSC